MSSLVSPGDASGSPRFLKPNEVWAHAKIRYQILHRKVTALPSEWSPSAPATRRLAVNLHTYATVNPEAARRNAY